LQQHPFLKRAKLPDVHLYDLRHTMATALFMAGVNPKIVSERLGHSSVTLTLDTYSHIIPGLQELATEKLEQVLFN
jgi:integrase